MTVTRMCSCPQSNAVEIPAAELLRSLICARWDSAEPLAPLFGVLLQ